MIKVAKHSPLSAAADPLLILQGGPEGESQLRGGIIEDGGPEALEVADWEGAGEHGVNITQANLHGIEGSLQLSLDRADKFTSVGFGGDSLAMAVVAGIVPVHPPAAVFAMRDRHRGSLTQKQITSEQDLIWQNPTR